MAEPALQLLPAEEAAAEAAATQTAKLVVIEGGQSAAAEAAGAEVAVEGFLAGAGVVAAGIAAALLVLLWPSQIAPEPTTASRSKPQSTPTPSPASPVEECSSRKTCEEMVAEIQDAIDRDKRAFNNKGIHGLRRRWQELIDGPCGPGQRPYRVNNRGDYVPTPVWENHVDEFNRTKNALRNRVYRAIEAGCDIPDDILDEAADAERMQPPRRDQWKGDPARPCLDSEPPPGWPGSLQPPSTRGLSRK